MATGDDTDPGTGPLPEEPTAPTGTSKAPAPEGEHPTELRDDDTGRWQITTQTSLYVIDLTGRTLFRLPGTAEHGIDRSTDPNTVLVVNSLPDDHQPQRLLRLDRCAIGAPLIVHTYGSIGASVRASTLIREIRPLPRRVQKDPRHG